MRIEEWLRRCVAGGVAFFFMAVLTLAGCSGGALSATCGVGTHLSGGTCLADDAGGGGAASDSGLDSSVARVSDAAVDGSKPGVDAGGSRDATNGDALVTADANGMSTEDGGDDDGAVNDDASIDDANVSDAGDDAALDDADEDSSVPVSCADTNICIHPTVLDGGGYNGGFNYCASAYAQMAGDQSVWLEFVPAPDCTLPTQYGLTMAVRSGSASSKFDLEIYQASAWYTDGPCPALTELITAVPEAGGYYVASYSFSNPTTQIFIHIVAESTCVCETGEPWWFVVETT